MSLPQDPYILLSLVNMKLRDACSSLEELCDDLDTAQEDLISRLSAAGFHYDPVQNQFREQGGTPMSDVLNYDESCLFCKIIKGDIPSKKVYEDHICYAFYDIAPQAPTHFLVVPKAHIASCGEITKGNSAIVAHIFEVIAKVTADMGIPEFRVVSNCGEQAGQSVHHLHFHVLAGRDMTWPPG